MFVVNALRVVILLLCVVSLILMGAGFAQHRKVWNNKTRDYWYGRCMWSVAGAVGMFEGLARGTPFRYGLVFFLVASLVTVKGALQKGPWGTPPTEDD